MIDLEYSNFDWNNYVSHYEDLKKDNINTKEKAWKHWINHGKKEGRQFFDLSEMKKIVSNEIKELEKSVVVKPITPVDDNFNWKKYVSYYQDLKNDNVDTKEKAWNHWIRHGEKEGRLYFDNTEYKNFDWEAYVEFYSDLHDDNIKKKEKAWEHWFKFGKKENRIYFDLKNITDIPNGFDWEDYVNNYDDLKNITNEELALKHWFNCGKNEKRSFTHKNTTKTKKYSFENIFFINLACHYLSLKYNTTFDYQYYDSFKKIGIDLFIGKNTYKNNFMLTNDNFFTRINEANNDINIKKENITLSDDFGLS